MRFIISFQTKKRTFVIGRGEKQYYHFVSMVIAVMYKLLQVGISKEDLQNCIRIAEDMVNKEK